MRRLLPLLACLAFIVALPASASDSRSIRGSVTAVSSSSISVQDPRGVVMTCTVGASSPSVADVAVGDRVEERCAGRPGHLVLVRLKKASSNSDTAAPKVTFAGAVTALSATSVSLHDGDRDLTCSIGPSSPVLNDVTVGKHIAVVCVGGVLTEWKPVGPPPVSPQSPPSPAPPSTPPASVTTTAGSLSALSASEVTVHNAEHGDVTCSVGANSPSLDGFRVGDRVGMICSGGVLVKLAHLSDR